MSKTLNGKELAGFIKERQARQVRRLRQAEGIIPKLLIVTAQHTSTAIDTYVRLKCAYAADILIETEVRSCNETEMPKVIAEANIDVSIHGIIVQLPLEDVSKTDAIVQAIAPQKDVDGLGSERASFVSATAEAIDWLLSGYNVALHNKRIAIVGRGRLVGAPLERLWSGRGLDVTTCDEHSTDTEEVIRRSDVIVTATGRPHLITTEMVKDDAVVVDAGTASEDGLLVGDVDASVRERRDVTITPEKGGVGPLTIAVMIDHVIQAAEASKK